MSKRLLTALCALLITSVVVGQTKAPTKKQNIHRNGGIACGSDPILPTDGSATDDYVAPGTSGWYYVHLKAGHSYSVDVWDSTDSVISGSATLALIASDCSTVVSTTDATSVDPDLSNDFGKRISWIQASDANNYLQVGTTDPSGNAYTIRITDTTLRNPRWSTYGGFSTQYAFLNNTAGSITGTLTIYDSNGVFVSSVPGIVVPAKAESYQILSTPINKVGFAVFGFIGPPGAITADAYFLNASGSVIVPSSFGPRNYQH